MSIGVRTFFRYGLPVLLWASLIFSASTDLGSASHTSRFIGPVLRWLFPGIADTAVQKLKLGIRKSAHATEYAVFAVLVWRARFRPGRENRLPWSNKLAWQAWAAATFYAMTDEYHQSFSPSREGSVRDVLIDSLGAAMGLWLVHRWGRFRRWW